MLRTILTIILLTSVAHAAPKNPLGGWVKAGYITDVRSGPAGVRILTGEKFAYLSLKKQLDVLGKTCEIITGLDEVDDNECAVERATVDIGRVEVTSEQTKVVFYDWWDNIVRMRDFARHP